MAIQVPAGIRVAVLLAATLPSLLPAQQTAQQPTRPLHTEEQGQELPAIEAPQTGLQPRTPAEYTAQMTAVRQLVQACQTLPAACDPDKIGTDSHITLDSANRANDAASFNVHWNWLRDLLGKAKDPKLEARDALLQTAMQRLNDQARDAGLETSAAAPNQANSNPAVPFPDARARANAVLGGSEFRHVTKNTQWDEWMGRLGEWLDHVFGGISSLGQNHRWLGPLIEWSFIALAIVAVLVWAVRVTQRQRLAIRLEASAGLTRWQEVSRDWAELASAAAAQADWRLAIHALYWASVTELEGRRVWRQNSARTPREYLRLLQPDAPQLRPLRQLTHALERIWYGLAPAAREDYDQAVKLYAELRAA